MQRSIRLKGQSGVPPFGYPDRGDTPATQPLSLQSIIRYNLRDEWVMQDLDQQHPDVQGWGISSYVAEPVHGNVRMTLYFDWSVVAEPIDEEGG